MGPLTASTDDVLWIPVEDDSAAGRVRRAASHRAASLGFSTERTGEVAIAATELATNLYRHAKQGVIFIGLRRAGDAVAIELIAIDSGPGMGDIGQSSRDGNSTRGTLGIGLGAVIRLATWFDAHSVPGRGTVIAATFWPESAPVEPPTIAGLTRPMNGESACGDAWAQRVEGDATYLMLADGLGHGELAAIAAREAVRTFLDDAGQNDLTKTMHRLNGALRSTRGAAVGLARVDREAGEVSFAGIGNIAAWVDDTGRRQGLVSIPGIVGHNGRNSRQMSVKLPERASVVMHSDGLSSKWDLDTYPGLRAHDPRIIAATLIRDAGVRHDDASIVVG